MGVKMWSISPAKQSNREDVAIQTENKFRFCAKEVKELKKTENMFKYFLKNC